MSGPDASAEVRRIAARLGELAERLRDPELADESAETLAREAAELVSRAGTELDRALREAGAAGE